MAHKPFRRPQDASTQTPAAPFAGQGALGTILLLTGAGIVLSAVNDPAGSGAWFRDGELVVCPGPWPDNYLDPDYVAPDEDAGDAP